MKEILTETYENHNHSLYGFENGESCTWGHNPRMVTIIYLSAAPNPRVGVPNTSPTQNLHYSIFWYYIHIAFLFVKTPTQPQLNLT